MSDKYYRLICLVVNVCPEPLRELFLKLAKSDPSRPYIDLQAYLTLRQHEILRLKGRRIIRDDQYDLLFPHVESPDTSAWDVTLLVILIKNLFRVQPLEKISLDEIRTVRNELQHLPTTSTITDVEYDNFWGRLDSAATFLARQVSGATYESIIVEKIQKTRRNNMPNLGDTLRYFYEENIKRNNKEMAEKMADMSGQMTLMEQHMNEMKENNKNLTEKIQNLERTIQFLETKTDSVAVNSKQSNFLLRNATVTKTGPNGEKVKRFKTVDHILQRLLRRFQSSMQTELPDNFIPPAEVADIRARLRDKHHVVVTGNQKSRYIETTFFVIKSLKYNIARCVEMSDASDWCHIDPDETDLVLIRDPFGTHAYDENKTQSMLDIFDSLLHAVIPKGDKKILDLIIVTESSCLWEVKALKEHDLLEDVVKLFDTTSESQPADLTTDPHIKNTTNCHQTNFTRQMSDILLSKFSEDSKRVDQEIFKEAKAKLKQSKMLVLSGWKGSGKTALAVALASSYPKEEVLLLTTPEDIRAIDFKRTSLVIVVNFAGRYGFDKKKVIEWYSRFDQLNVALSAGKLNVIVTCERTKHQRSIQKIGQHPLLSNTLIVSKRPITIKQEPTRLSGISQGSSFSNPLPGTSVGVSRDDVRSVQSVREYSVRIHDERSCSITGCCTLPGGEILLADRRNNRLKKLDSAYNVISVCGDLPGYPRGVCYIGNNVAVVTSYTNQLMYVDVSSMTVRNTVTTNHSCESITCHNDKLYVMSDDTVYMYTLDSNNWSTLYKLKNNTFIITGIAVSGDGNRIYITHLNTRLTTIDSFGNLLNVLTLPGAYAVCVDDRENVWVGSWSNKLYQVSADGARLLDTVSVDKLNARIYALCYDRDRSSLIAGGESDIINVIRLY